MTERISVWTYPKSEELSPEMATAATEARMWIGCRLVPSLLNQLAVGGLVEQKCITKTAGYSVVSGRLLGAGPARVSFK
jgi:hypothetical protein